MRRIRAMGMAIGLGCLLATGCETGDRGAAAGPLAAAEPRDDLIPVGSRVPDFEALDQEGRPHRLADLLETRHVVLVFYPADFTPGCTRQLCAVRDDWSEFEQREAIVLGVNPADVETHAKFAEEYGFPFPVISDTDARIAAAYGASGENPAFPQRTVYVIHKDGRVALAERGMVTHEKIFAALDGA